LDLDHAVERNSHGSIPCADVARPALERQIKRTIAGLIGSWWNALSGEQLRNDGHSISPDRVRNPANKLFTTEVELQVQHDRP
jgi:hypothetical protein